MKKSPLFTTPTKMKYKTSLGGEVLKSGLGRLYRVPQIWLPIDNQSNRIVTKFSCMIVFRSSVFCYSTLLFKHISDTFSIFQTHPQTHSHLFSFLNHVQTHYTHWITLSSHKNDFQSHSNTFLNTFSVIQVLKPQYNTLHILNHTELH